MARDNTCSQGLCCLVLLIICFVCFAIILPFSFSSLELDEYGLLQRRSTGVVSPKEVYGSGLHLVGPDHHFKKFKAMGHDVKFDLLSVFTADNLEVHLSITFQFFLIKEDLPDLHTAYDIYYEPILVSNAKEAIISTCSRFDTDQFINDRDKIWLEIYQGVKRKLGGSCCIPNCKINCPNCSIHERCVNGCKSRAQGCANADKGFFAEVRYFQLHDIDVPNQVMERRLLGLVRDLEKEREEYLNQEALVKKQTDILASQFRNNATQSVAYSNALAQLIREKAKADALKRVETARVDAMSTMCTRLDITQPKHISTLQYLRTLKDSADNIKYSIDFSHAIAQQSQSKISPPKA